jgi:hypothetical protein
MFIFCLSRKVWSAMEYLFYKDVHKYQHQERWNLFLESKHDNSRLPMITFHGWLLSLKLSTCPIRENMDYIEIECYRNIPKTVGTRFIASGDLSAV